jgi:acyl-CoA thioester hydrolase
LYQRGLSPSQLVQEFGIVLPLRELTMNFHKPGRLDDLLQIDQVIEKRSRTQITVKQTATRINEGTEPELLASAVLHIVCVDTTTLKPKGLPDWLFKVDE